MAALRLLCCTQALSVCREQGLLSSCRAQASHRSAFSHRRASALGTQASVAVARGLRSCGSRTLELWLSSCGAWA